MIPPVHSVELGDRSLVLFDADCGFCRRNVRFLLRRDAAGTRFAFAPLAGSTAAAALDSKTRAALPDSLLVLTPAGELLMRSDAALHLGARLGGGWRLLAALARPLPRGLRDRAYDALARRRQRLGGDAESCALPDPGLTGRFLP